MQTLTLLMTVAHYVKREYETLYVHRFSLASMPWRNLPKNCAHYWLLGGLLVAYPMYAPTFRPSTILQVRYVPFLPADVGLILLWLFAETSNFATHLILRNLRPEGTKARKIPRGYGFDLVSCPNYFFEILGWVCLTGLTGSPYGETFGTYKQAQTYT